MVKTLTSAAFLGLTCSPIHVEVDVTKAWPGFFIVGLGDTAIQEAKERIRSAWTNVGLVFPNTSRVVINLAPADSRKVGTQYDLPMAVGMYLALYEPSFSTEHTLIVGELGLSGEVRPIPGILGLLLFAKRNGYSTVFVPKQNEREATLIPGIQVHGVSSLQEMIAHMEQTASIPPAIPSLPAQQQTQAYGVTLSDIKGHHNAKRALEIAAAGGHNLIMTGPPGSGKTLLARSIVSILPPLTIEESIEVTHIYSIAGLLEADNPLLTTRPFRSPHHSASGAALVGGGRIPKPGEVTLSHHGVLFLDELPEFPRHVLEHLRQPLEDGVIHISRASTSLSFPARCMLLASQNPCPCGFFGDKDIACTCSAHLKEQYQKRLSGPLLDRIDIHMHVPRISFDALIRTGDDADTSDTVRERVSRVRQKQYVRTNPHPKTNAELSGQEIDVFCALSEEAKEPLARASKRAHLSGRAIHRILRVARTIADIRDAETISSSDVSEAIRLRQGTDSAQD